MEDLKKRRVDEEVISSLRGIDDDHQLEDGMEFFSIQDWLMNSMEKKKVGEVKSIEDIDDFF